MSLHSPTPLQTIQVYQSAHLKVSEGANFGDSLSFADDIMLDDVYQIVQGAIPARLSFIPRLADNHYQITADTEIGTPGYDLYLDSMLTFMAPDGKTFEAMILVEVDQGHAHGVFLLPMAAMHPKYDYRLVGLERDGLARKLAQVSCLSFARGTHITLSSGQQVPIETLQAGDKVLTRNAGAQPLSWVGQNTVRAVGDFAPVVIGKGVLNNQNDLSLSPDHRLFIYQRSDALGAGRSQLLVKARHLVNGTTVIRQEGGFVDYFQLLFDKHHIIYAEGIATESLLVDTRSRQALPEELKDKVQNSLSPHETSRHRDLEVNETLINMQDAAAKLRAASQR